MSQSAARWTAAVASLEVRQSNADPGSLGPGLSPEKEVDLVDSACIKVNARRSNRCERVVPAPSLTPRELAILLALDQYRYLDREQLERLFFETRRTAQSGLRELLLRQLILRWERHEPGTSTPRPSVYVLSPRGAALLSRAMANDPRPAVARARLARSRAYHVLHDIEANGFFVGLAADSVPLTDQGLYHWVGATGCKRAAGQDGSPSSDGWGRYLLPDRELLFDLEWDRGTEHERRLRQKATAYIAHFRGRRGSRLRHVLLVAPTDRREAELRRVIAECLPKTAECCRFWTTTVAFIDREGALGRIWLEVGSREPGLVAFAEIPGVGWSNRPVSDSIGKPRWWERRRGGGEGA